MILTSQEQRLLRWSKFYAIKSRCYQKPLIISTLFAIVVSGGCYFLGGFGRLFSDQVDVVANGFDSIIPTMLSGLSDVLIGLVVLLVLSASMSTLSSLVIASSSTLTLDFINKNFVKDMSEKTQVRMIRVLIVVFILISVVIALIQYNSSVTFIAQLMGISWGALAGSFLGPLIYGLYWKKTTKSGCWASFIFGAGIAIMVICARRCFLYPCRSPIIGGAFAAIAARSWCRPSALRHRSRPTGGGRMFQMIVATPFIRWHYRTKRKNKTAEKSMEKIKK